MIHIDPRAGSGPLLPLFLAHRSSTPARHSPLAAADFCFPISGPGNTAALMGIERKTITDLMSSLRLHRLAEQIPKLLDHYHPHVYILIEGDYRTSWETGYLEHRRKIDGKWIWTPILFGKHPFLASEIDGALTSVTEKTGIRLWRTRDEKETVDWVINKYHWGEKDWDKHQAHMGIYSPEPYVGVDKASDVRRFAYALRGSPGAPMIGWEKSGAVEAKFKTIVEAVNAPVEEWLKVEGVGKVLANRIWKRLRGIQG